MTHRILIAKVGLDGHESGAKMIAAILRDAGHEVIYLGKRNSVEQVVEVVIQEDVDLIGVSLLSGIHLETARNLRTALEAHDLEVPVVMGGIIPPQDIPELKSEGVRCVFGPGSNTQEIVTTVARLLEEPSRAHAKRVT